METKSSLGKHALNYGLIVGLAFIVYSIILYIADLTTSTAMTNLSYLILIAGVIVGIMKFRDNERNGVITYGNAVGYGVILCVISAVITSIYSYIQVTVIDPELPAKILEIQEGKLLEKGFSEDQVEMQIEMSKKFMKPVIMSIISFFSLIFIGTIISLIVSAFLKKDPNPLEEASN